MCEHEDPKPFGHKAFLQDERLRQLNELNANEKHGCHGGDGSTLPMNPPILTAAMADNLDKRSHGDLTFFWFNRDEFTALQAIATGRTACVPVMTEAQAREAFDKWAGEKEYTFDIELFTWLAALRHAGVLK